MGVSSFIVKEQLAWHTTYFCAGDVQPDSGLQIIIMHATVVGYACHFELV